MDLTIQQLSKELNGIKTKVENYNQQLQEVYEFFGQLVDEQQNDIKQIQRCLNAVNEQIYNLQQQIQSLKHHLDNGWKADLVNKILEQNVDYIGKLIDKKLQLAAEEKEQIIERERIKNKRRIIDINKLLLIIFSSSGIVYMILDIIKRMLEK